ncbi:MAG: hypothetical protein ACI9ND_002565, partial [Yoonia sp.]
AFRASFLASLFLYGAQYMRVRPALARINRFSNPVGPIAQTIINLPRSQGSDKGTHHG